MNTIAYSDINSSEALSDDYLHVNSCGCQTLNTHDAHRIRRHGRIDYHMLYISRGKCTVSLEGRPVEAPAGSLILFRPRELHDYAFNHKDASVSWWVHFSGTGCEALLAHLGLLRQSIAHIGLHPDIEQAFRLLIRTNQEGGAFSQALCAALLARVLCVAARLFSECHIDPHLRHDRFGPIITLLSEEYRRDITLEECAALCGISRSRFSHLFREKTGRALHQYLLEIRLNHAKELLSDTDCSVQEIALDCGYADQSYFSRLFRRHMGLSPLEYRRAVRGV